jgi:hypothetical protein
MYPPPAPYPYAYPPPPQMMGYGGYRNDDRKKKMMLALIVVGAGFWYFKTNYKSPQEMMKHLSGKLDKITLGDIAKSGATQFVKHKLGTTGKFIWLAKELEPLVKPKIIAHLPNDPLPDDFLDTAGDTYSFITTKDPNEYIILKDIA